MVKPKFGKCIDCPPDKPERYLIAGRCHNHYWQQRRLVSMGKSKERKEADPSRKTLYAWFEYHTTHNNWICENCGEELHPYSPKVASSCQAHILPKEHFKSVQGVLENHMTLGDLQLSCFCHDEYDSNWKNAQAMPVFKIATERFLRFKHLILPQEVKKLPAVFYDLYYQNNN